MVYNTRVEIAKWSGIIIPYEAAERRIREKFRQMYNSLTRYDEWALIFFFSFSTLIIRRSVSTFRGSFVSHRRIVTSCTCSMRRTLGLERIFCNPYFEFRNSCKIWVKYFFLLNFKYGIFGIHVHYYCCYWKKFAISYGHTCRDSGLRKGSVHNWTGLDG